MVHEAARGGGLWWEVEVSLAGREGSVGGVECDEVFFASGGTVGFAHDESANLTLCFLRLASRRQAVMDVMGCVGRTAGRRGRFVKTERSGVREKAC